MGQPCLAIDYGGYGGQISYSKYLVCVGMLLP